MDVTVGKDRRVSRIKNSSPGIVCTGRDFVW